jgi:hypothetical protein
MALLRVRHGRRRDRRTADHFDEIPPPHFRPAPNAESLPKPPNA